jgi:hypothetical protein
MAVNYHFMHCEPQIVFDVLADGWVFPTWVVGASRMRGVEGHWPSPGSNIHHSFGIWPLLLNDVTSVLEWDAPMHALLKARAWPVGQAHVAMDVRERRGGCVVRMTEDVIAGPARLIPTPLIEPVTIVRNRESLRRLGFIAEGWARDGKPDASAGSTRTGSPTAA